MKAYIYTKNDWDYEVIDVFLGIYDDNDELLIERDIKGFDDVEWKEANEFAEELSKTLNIDFIGDKTDT